jgi:hypothetical protein
MYEEKKIYIYSLKDVYIYIEYQLFKPSDIMQYQRVTDDASLIVTETGESHLFSSSLGTNRNFCRVRKSLLILVLIQLVSLFFV